MKPYWNKKGNVVWLDKPPSWWQRWRQGLYPVYDPTRKWS